MNSEIFFVFNMSKLMWYKGSGKFVSDFTKAKLYKRKCDASNAITYYRDGRSSSKTGNIEEFQIHVYSISPVCENIIPVPSVKTKKETKYLTERGKILKQIESVRAGEHTDGLINDKVNELNLRLVRLDNHYRR
jgi:hypothetical protein